MARRAPDATSLVDSLIDLGLIAARVCEADGRLSTDERRLLNHIRVAKRQAERVNLNRLKAKSWLDYGEITDSLIRAEREFEARNELAACPGEDDAA